MKTLGLFAAAACAASTAGCINLYPPSDRTVVERTLERDPGWMVSDKVLILDVRGTLVNEQQDGLLTVGDNPTALFIEKCRAAEADPDVKAVVLRIDSPGGTVTASELMYQAVVRLKEKKEKEGGKFPIIAFMVGVAASGGYYIASAADEIHAMPGTVTGSIGVIMIMPQFVGLMDKIGVKVKALKSGPNKDAGSPFREMAANEEKYFQDEIIKRYYDQFIERVQKSRKNIAREKLLALADGSVYLGVAAKEKGLVDELGTLENAIEKAAKEAGLGPKKVVVYHRPSGWKGSIYAQAPAGPTQPQINLLNINVDRLWLGSAPSFLYLWQPGL